ILWRFSANVQPLYAEFQAKLGKLSSILEENVAGVRIVKGFAREAYERARYRGVSEELLSDGVDAIRAMSRNGPRSVFLANLSLVVVIAVGGIEVMNQQMTLGKLVAFVSYLSLVFGPLSTLTQIVSSYARAATSSQRIFDVLDASIEVQDSPTAVELPPVE